jgi:hypothetical protein
MGLRFFGLDRRLLFKLFINGVEDNSRLAGFQRAQVLDVNKTALIRCHSALSI